MRPSRPMIWRSKSTVSPCFGGEGAAARTGLVWASARTQATSRRAQGRVMLAAGIALSSDEQVPSAVLLKEVVRRVGEAGSNGVGRRARTPFGQTFNYPPARKYRAGCGDASSFFRILSSSGGGGRSAVVRHLRADRAGWPHP